MPIKSPKNIFMAISNKNEIFVAKEINCFFKKQKLNDSFVNLKSKISKKNFPPVNQIFSAFSIDIKQSFK